MSDRKYRQRGYMDEGRGEPQKTATSQKSPTSKTERVPREMRAPSMPGFRDVVRCVRCGNPITVAIGFDSRCGRCGTDLHSCAECASFDPGARFECMQAIPARVTPKDTANTCTLFEARTTVERETGSAAPQSARTAFDDLFK